MIKNYLVFILLISSFMFGEEKDDKLTDLEDLKLRWEIVDEYNPIEFHNRMNDSPMEIISTTLYPDGLLKEVFVHKVSHDTVGTEGSMLGRFPSKRNYLRYYSLYDTNGDLKKIKDYSSYFGDYDFIDYYSHPSTKELTGTYNGNRKHGHWTWWSTDGEVNKKCTYQYGKKISKDEHIDF